MKKVIFSLDDFQRLSNKIQQGDICFCQNMQTIAQNIQDLKKRIDFILSKGACIYFQEENVEFSTQTTPEQKEIYRFLEIFDRFERSNIQKRRLIGIQKAKEQGRYNKERAKKIPLDLRDIMIKEKESGIPVSKIIQKYHISRKTFYNYTQGATKNILKNIQEILKNDMK